VYTYNEFTFSNEGDGNLYVIKYSHNGDINWFSTVSSSTGRLSSCSEFLEVDKNGELIITGYFRGIVNFGENQIIFPYSNTESVGFFITKLKNEPQDILIFNKATVMDYCNGSKFILSYESDTCIPQNRFYAHLSDENGDFKNGIFIGDTLTRLSGEINCTIPEGVKAGNYKIRVVASNPHTWSNEQSLTIKNCSTNVDKLTTGSYFNIYPNPNNGNISITGEIKEPATLMIKSLTGTIAYQEENFKPKSLNLNLTPGIYFVELRSDKERLVKKVVVHY
nr:T9SS type A sorting domain-containing protein [Bacteroidota bacterium]